jgi:hypothetical protein
MLVSDSSATKPAAAPVATGVALFEKKPTIIGDAFSRMPMPAVTLQHRMTHSSQNCGVRKALLAVTSAVVIIGLTTCFGIDAGRQPGAGTRTSSAPSDMNTA